MSAAPDTIAPMTHDHRHTPTVDGHDHAHGHGHGHAHSHAHHHHSHAPGERHPTARLSPSLLRASLAQRLAIAVPVAAVLWGLALWVVYGGAA